MSTTPDGLLMHEQEGVGLVISAPEHNYMLSRWEAQLAELQEELAESKMWADACAGILNEDGTLLAQRDFETAKRRAQREAKT